MLTKNNWMLPEGIDELLPEQAARSEKIRQELLGLFKTWGYQFVIPPLVEYLDTLLNISDREIELQTFKLTDQISGKTLGVRADMTPQVARMAAHHILNDSPSRLCYLGPILKARGAKIEKSRSPIQIGAELYGSAHINSDVEIIQLMLEVLAVTGLQKVHLDLGHVAIFRGLARQAGLSVEQEADLLEVLQRKSTDEVTALLHSFELESQWVNVFNQLLTLNGDISIIEKAKDRLVLGDEMVQKAILELEEIAQVMQRYYPSLPLYFDLAELRCYHYQTGVVFAAFVPGFGSEVARGGRYDNMTGKFGRSQPATGFSSDMKILAQLSSLDNEPKQEIILAPCLDEPDLYDKVRELRAQGHIVIKELPNSTQQPEHTTLLVKKDKQWLIN